MSVDTNISVAPSPATVEVVQHAFISGAEQMRRNLYRSAYSPVIYEAKDCSVGLYDEDGELLGQAPGLPFFLGSLGGSIRAVIDRKGKSAFEEGDIWVVNDSSICGSHLNDATVFMPIYWEGRLRGFSGAKAHWSDVGAKEPGYVSDSVDIFQEGLRIGPTRLWHAGELDQQILDLLALNSRFPDALVGDLMAEVAACRTGEERFRSILARYGWPTVEAAIGTYFGHAEADDRRSVTDIPDGVYTASGSLDGDGIDDDMPVQVVVTVRVAGDHMTIDLTGSSQQSRGSINSGLVQSRSAIQQAFKFLVNPTTPASGGSFRNLDIVVPKGSCFDPAPEAAYLHYGPHLMLAMDLVVKSVSAAAPERAAAGHVGDSWNVTFTNAVGRPVFVSGESLSGGWGGYEGGDGESALIHSAAGDFKNVPVETMEQRYPLRLLRHSLRKRSAGKGRFRGGLGIERVYEVLADVRLSLWFERSKTPSWGLRGGGDGAPPEVYVTRPGEERRRLLKANALAAPTGTLVEVFTGGGGGWGLPQERSETARRDDKRLGLG